MPLLNDVIELLVTVLAPAMLGVALVSALIERRRRIVRPTPARIVEEAGTHAS